MLTVIPAGHHAYSTHSRPQTWCLVCTIMEWFQWIVLEWHWVGPLFALLLGLVQWWRNKTVLHADLEIYSTHVTVWHHQILDEYVMSFTHSQLSSVVFCSSKIKLTRSVVRAAKCKFIVLLYLLGAAYGGRDYVCLQDKSTVPSHLWFTAQLGAKWS